MKSKEELLEEAKKKLSLLDAQIGELHMQEESRAKLKKMEDALADVNSIRTSIGSMKADFDRASKEIERLWAEVQKRDFAVPERIDVKLSEHDAAIRELSKKVTGEKELLAAYRNSVASLLRDLGAIKQEDFETLKKSLDERLVGIPELEAKIEGMAEKLRNLAGLEARLRDIDSEAKKVALDFERRMESVGKISLELEKIKASVAVEISKIPFFDAKLSGISVELEKVKKADFAESIGELHEETRNALQTNKKELEQMKAYVDDAVSELRRDESESGEMLEGVTAAVQGLKKSLEKDIAALEAKINELSAPEDMRAKIIEHDAAVKELNKKVTGEREMLAAYRSSMANLLKEIGAIKKEDLETLKKSLDERMTGLPALEVKIKEITGELQGIGELGARVDDTDSTVKKVALEFEKAKADAAAELSKFRAIDAKLSEISDEIKKLKKADFAGGIGELKLYLDRTEKEIRKEIRGIKQDGESNKKELEQMKAHMSKELQNLHAVVKEKTVKSAVENLVRERQSILATLNTIKSGYEEKLISKEDYEEIVRENERKIAEIDTRIAEMSK